MGKYTQHWAEYSRRSNRRTLQLLGVLLLLPLVAALGYGLSSLGDWSIYVTLALLVVWLVVFTRLALRSTKVSCPQCATEYARGKYLTCCPTCGLRMFQDDPA